MKLDPETEGLIRRAAADDEQAIDQLMARHHDRLQRMVAVRMDQRLRTRLDPADIVQDGMVKAVARLPVYLQDRPIAFYPWLRQIVWEQMIEAFRKHVGAQRRTVDREVANGGQYVPPISDQSAVMLADVLVAQQSTPSQHMMGEQMKQQVQLALGQLQTSYRELLVMRYLEELSMKEIAECIGTSVAAVKMRHMRAITQLGTALGTFNMTSES